MNSEGVFATGATLNVGDTYVRFRFTKENLDLNGSKEGNEVVADVMMSPELFKAIVSMSHEALKDKEKESV